MWLQCLLFFRLRLITTIYAHSLLTAEARPNRGGSLTLLISPPESLLLACFCSPLLPSDFHYKYPLTMCAWGDKEGRLGPHKEKGKATRRRSNNDGALTFLAKKLQGFIWIRHGPVSHAQPLQEGRVLVWISLPAAGIQGELLPPKD